MDLRVEEVGKASQQGLLRSLVLGLVVQDLVAERLAKVQGLEHRVAVACVTELQTWKSRNAGRKKSDCKTHIYESEIMLAIGKLVLPDVPFQL